MANLSQTRPNILPQIFCFLYEHIETQNLGKAQALGALPAVTPLYVVIRPGNRATLGPLRTYFYYCRIVGLIPVIP